MDLTISDPARIRAKRGIMSGPGGALRIDLRRDLF